MNRYDLEAKLARALGSGLTDAYRELLRYLGDPPNIDNVPDEYWQNGWRDIQKKVEPILVEVFLESAEEVMRRFEFGVDLDLVNVDAANWARAHSEAVMQSLFNKRYTAINENVARYFEEGWSVTELAGRLRQWYSPVRAEMIAITEVTRAVVEGERAIVRRLERESGDKMVEFWSTANDERVCPICFPRNNKEITDGIYPPAHPRCRCLVVYKLPKRKEVSIAN